MIARKGSVVKPMYSVCEIVPNQNIGSQAQSPIIRSTEKGVSVHCIVALARQGPHLSLLTSIQNKHVYSAGMSFNRAGKGATQRSSAAGQAID